MNKYRAKRVECDGIWFDSKAECEWYQGLRALERAGEITSLEPHPVIPIHDGQGRHVCDVEADAFWFDLNEDAHFGDFKGRDNAMSKLKRKLAYHFAGIEIELYGPAAKRKARARVKAKPRSKGRVR